MTVASFLCKILNGAMHDSGGFGLAFDEGILQLALAYLFGRLVAERIVIAARPLAPIVEKRLEGPLAGAVAQESFRRAELGIVGVDRYGRELCGAVLREREPIHLLSIRHASGKRRGQTKLSTPSRVSLSREACHLDSAYYKEKAAQCRKLAGMALRPSMADELLRLAQEYELEAVKAEIRATAGDKPGRHKPES
jgi:hypothetical protein